MGYQLLFSSILFDIPLLDKLKSLFLRLVVDIGPGSYIRHATFFNSSHANINGMGKLKIGKGVLIKQNCEIDYSGNVTIGDNVNIAQHVMIFTHGHSFKDKNPETVKNINFTPIVIHDHVVIGSGAKIMDTVGEIGEGAVIAAGAVVIKDVPPYTVMLGNPARPIFKRGEGNVSV